MCGDLLLKFLKLYQKFRVLTERLINEFIRISPIAWFYITFTGRYNFKKNNGKIDLQEILNTLEAKIRTSLWKKEKI